MYLQYKKIIYILFILLFIQFKSISPILYYDIFYYLYNSNQYLQFYIIILNNNLYYDIFYYLYNSNQYLQFYKMYFQYIILKK